MSPFLKHVVQVLKGATIAQLIIVALLPVLSRLFSPDSFALAQSFTGLMSLMVIVGCFRYDMAITVADENEVGPLLILTTGFAVVSALILALIIAFAAHQAPASWHLERFNGLAAVAFVGAVVVVASNAWSQVMIRTHRFTAIANGRMSQAGCYGVAACAIGFLHGGNHGLVYADLIGRIALLAVLGLCLLTVFRGQRLWRSGRHAITLIGRYRFYPLISLPAGFLGSVGMTFNTVWMLLLFDPATAGAYAIIERALNGPIALIGGAIAQVYQGQFASSLRARDPAALHDFRALLMTQAKIGIVPAVIMGVTAPFIFPLVLGKSWSLSGVFCQIMTPLLLLNFVCFPVNLVLQQMQKQISQLLWEICRFVLVAGSWYVAHRLSWSPKVTIAVTSAAASVAQLGFVGLAYFELKRLIRHKFSEPSETQLRV